MVKFELGVKESKISYIGFAGIKITEPKQKYYTVNYHFINVSETLIVFSSVGLASKRTEKYFGKISHMSFKFNFVSLSYI